MNKTRVLLVVSLALLLSGCVQTPKEPGQAVATGTGTVGAPVTTLTEPVPGYIINRSSDYIKSLVGSDYFARNLTVTDNKTIQSGTGGISYIVSYLYHIPQAYLSSPGASYVSVSLDKDGNIIDYVGPKKPHSFSITKEQVIEISRKSGLKEPIIAGIDRILSGNSSDGYVWVATGVIDKTTCKNIGGTQECLIPGRYIDVDDGSVIGEFNSSSLIRHQAVI